MSYDYDNLIRKLNHGYSFEYLFFYSHKAKNEEIGEWCLSQWWPCKFEVEDIEYNSAEQFMMAEKAKLFNDIDSRNLILKTSDPSIVKNIGKQIKNFDEKEWNYSKYDLVLKGNFNKFGQNENLKKYLRSTEEKILVEASPCDKIWGIGLDINNPDIRNPYKWQGENLLGFVLTEVRRLLSIEE